MINEEKLKTWMRNTDFMLRDLAGQDGEKVAERDEEFINEIFVGGDICVTTKKLAKPHEIVEFKIGDLIKLDFDDVPYVVWDDGEGGKIFVRTKVIGDSIFGNNNDWGKSLILRQFIPDWLKDILGDATETGFDIGIFPESVGLYQDNNLVGDFSIFTKEQAEIAMRNGSIEKIEKCWQWTKTAYSTSASRVWYVYAHDSTNSVGTGHAHINLGVSPVLWLKSDVRLSVVSGEGTKEEPYEVEIEGGK